MAKDFVLVRLVRIAGTDLNLFEFDYDLTWMAFLMNANEKIYGRYGGRDADGPEEHLSLVGLRYAMTAALQAHRKDPNGPPPARSASGPSRPEQFPMAKRARGCIHCHQVNEFRMNYLQGLGRWSKKDLWVFPPPENVGLSLEVDAGDKVRSVRPGSPAEKAGLRRGDRILSLNGRTVFSFADAQYTLHKGPDRGRIPVAWERGGKAMTASLELADGWKKSDITWRPSLLNLLPSLTVRGTDLTAAEKKNLGLEEKQLAFRQTNPVHSTAQAAGIREGDVIIGVDGLTLDLSMEEFLGYVRKNYLIGERITLNVLRGGKRVNLPVTLR